MKLDNSLEYYQKAVNLIPSATQTFSKGPRQYPFGVSPVFLDKGKGSHVWDIDGNEFIDYPMALGAVILGHNYPAVNKAVTKQLKKGIVYTLPHPLEAELSELLVDLIPCAEMVRFGKNGSDATSGAIRAARAYTGREKIACCGYHGWQDWFIGTTTRHKGVPQSTRELTLTFQYNDIESLKRIFSAHKGQIAAVIMEPVGVVAPENNFLQAVKELTQQNGSVLIFDEIVTGFRLSLGGAQEYYNVTPDLACFGKAMGSGMPISAVVGKKEIMKIFDEVFFSFTSGGECLSLAAALATLREIKEKGALKKIWQLGAKLRDGYNQLVEDMDLNAITECVGLAPHTVIVFKENCPYDPVLLRTLYQQEAIRRGVLAIGVHNVCYSHTSRDIDRTLEVYAQTLGVIKKAVQQGGLHKFINGKVVEQVFRKP